MIYTNYVVGFMFDLNYKDVVLIRKNRPLWQQNKLNGVGGKVEFYDRTIYHSIVREFQEEAGIKTSIDDWIHCITLNFDDLKLFVMGCSYEKYKDVFTTTDEIISIESVDSIFYRNDSIENLRYIIPLTIQRLNK